MSHPARAILALGWLVAALGPAVASPAAAAFGAAEARYANQDYAAAVEAYAAFLKAHANDPNAPQAAFRIAQCHGRLDRHDLAAEACAECYRRYPKTTYGDTALYNKGYHLMQAERWQPAAAAYFDYTKVGGDPNYRALAFYWRGEALFRLDRFADAAAAYRQFQGQPAEVLAADTVAPMLPWAYYSIVVSLQAADQPAESVAAADALLARYPEHEQTAEVLQRKGDCLRDLRRHDEATTAYQAVLDRFPQARHAPYALYGLLAIAQAQGDGARAEALSNRLATEYPDSAELLAGARFALARQALDAGDHAAAERLYRQALEGAAGEAEAIGLAGLAEALYEQKKYTEAEAAYNRLLNAHPGGAMADHARLRLGDVYLLQQKYEAAEKVYRDSLRVGVVDREFARIKYNLAVAVRGLGRRDEAVKLFWEAVEADPKAPLAANALVTLAGELAAAEPAEAARASRTFLQHHAADERAPDLRLILGGALAAEQKWAEAAAAYRALADQHPDHPNVERALARLADCYRALGDTTRERAAQAELQRRFPASDLAAQLLLDQGFQRFSAQQYAEAAELYETFLRQHPQHPNLPVVLGNLGASYYRASGLADHARQAAAVYRRLADEFPTAPAAEGALYWCGRALQNAGDTAGAIEALSRFVTQPDTSYHAAARSRLAEALLAAERYPEAVEAYRAAVAGAGDPAEANRLRLDLAEALALAGDVAESTRLLEQIAAAGETGDTAARARFQLAVRRHAAGDLETAAASFTAWLEAYPDHELRPQAAFNLARCEEDRGRYAEAAPLFARAAELLPTDSADRGQADYRRCRCLFLADDLSAATTALEALEASPRAALVRAESLLMRGLIAARRDQPAEAERVLRQVIEQHAESVAAPTARLQLGRLLQGQRQFDAARAVYLPLAEAATGDKAEIAGAMLGLAECYYSTNQVDPALDAFLRADAMGLAEISAQARYWAGECYRQKGDTERARDKFQRVINDYPTSDWAGRAKQALDGLAG